jgi:ribA/ribD-fused uncharacterized protein
MEKVIDKFAGDEFFLSNFYISPMIWNGKIYKSVEHAYQASKANNESEHEWIRNMDTPGKAKKNGMKVHLREDWEEIKLELMLELIRTKFLNPELSKKLVDTQNYLLVEGNYWHDNFFGNCTCLDCKKIEGQNHLGKILMKVRTELIQKYEKWTTTTLKL